MHVDIAPHKTPELPLCSFQHRYVAHWLNNPQSTAFNVSFAFEVIDGLDRRALRRACQYTALAHPVVHAVFTSDGTSQQYGSFDTDAFFEEITLNESVEAAVSISDLLGRPFDLTKGPLFRLTVADFKDQTFIIGAAHHSVADSVAAEVLVGDLLLVHDLYRTGIDVSIPQEHYAECVLEVERRAARSADVDEAYWTQFVADVPHNFALPQMSGEGQTNETSGSLFHEIDNVTSAALRNFTRRHDVSLFETIAAAFGSVVMEHADCSEIVLSHPVDVRPKHYARVAGCFVNLSLISVRRRIGERLASSIVHIHEQRKQSRQHQYFQLGRLAGAQGTKGSDIQTGLFRLFVGPSYLNSQLLSVGSLTLAPVQMAWNTEFDRDLRLLYDPRGDALCLRLDVNLHRYDSAFAKQILIEVVDMISCC